MMGLHRTACALLCYLVAWNGPSVTEAFVTRRNENRVTLPQNPSFARQRSAISTELRVAQGYSLYEACHTLGLDPSLIRDMPAIKKAYKKLALKYHPDANQHEATHIKQQYSDRLAEINRAYEMLTGKETPPPPPNVFRRSVPWDPLRRHKNEFRPRRGYNYSLHRLGDSDHSGVEDTVVEDIAEDLFVQYDPTQMNGGATLLFSDFLTSQEDGTPSRRMDDAFMRRLLQTKNRGVVEQEMTYTDTAVEQLNEKLKLIEDQWVAAQIELQAATAFSDRLVWEVEVAELRARKEVIEGYIQKARDRYSTLNRKKREMNSPKNRGYDIDDLMTSMTPSA